MLGCPAAWRKSSRSALHEARTLLGAGASISRTRPPVTPTCTVTSKSDVPLRQPLDLAGVLANLATVLDEQRSACSLEEEFGVTPRGVQRRRIRRRRAPAARRPRSGGAHSTHPSRISQSCHCRARDGGASRSGDSSRGIRERRAPRRGVSSSLLWSSPKLSMGQCDGHRRPRRGQNRRSRTPPRDTLCQIQSAAKDARVCSKGQLLGLSDGTGKRLRSRQQSRNTWNWPLLGLSQPGARPDIPAVKTSHSSLATRTGEQRRKGQRRRGKFRLGRDLHDLGLARPRDRARQFPATSKRVAHVFFALMYSCSREIEFRKFVNEEIATARSRHASRRRRVPMPASPRHRARCNRHGARPGIVALIWCCLVRLSTGGLGPPDEIASLPACTHRRIRRGAAQESRLDPLSFSDKALFLAVLNGTAISDPEQLRFSCDTENWACGQATSESTAKDIVSARISFSARAAIVPLLDGRTIFCNPKDPDALGDDSSFFAVAQQQWRACVRRLLRCKLASVLPTSSLDSRLASGAFAVAKGENRDRFIGDRRSLNSRERSIGRTQLPYCPRLRRMILEKSVTVQITYGDIKDCFYLYEVPPSRVTKQVIGLRILRSWPEHLGDEHLDVVDTDEIESWVSQDLP